MIVPVTDFKEPISDLSVATAIKVVNDPEYHYSMIQEALGVLQINLSNTLVEDLNIIRHGKYEVCTCYYKLKDGILGLRGVYRVYSDGMNDPVWDEIYKQRCVAFEGKRIPAFRYIPKHLGSDYLPGDSI